MAVAPFEKLERSVFFLAPFANLMKGVVLMICCLHLCFTYDNYECHIGSCGFVSNLCVVIQTQVKEKDNRPAS